ncbi:MAG: Gfo/Idh/MocA family protein, partial [Chitinophagaceae bacterium]
MLKVGIFGVGHLGKFHVQNWKALDGVEVVGFYDPNDIHAQQTIAEYGLKRFHSEEELIEASDAIDVVTPTQFHFPICEAALRKSKHVFVEKPLANDMEEARRLVKLVGEAKVKFQVGHVERFNPAFLALSNRSLQPMFIEVHRLAQFNPRGTEVSVILDLMIHDIDIILHL